MTHVAASLPNPASLAGHQIVLSLFFFVPRFLPFLLTNDAGVQMAVRPLALPLFLGCVLTAPVAVSEGVLLARRELKYLTGVYVLSTAVFPFFLMRVKAAGGPVVDVR